MTPYMKKKQAQAEYDAAIYVGRLFKDVQLQAERYILDETDAGKKAKSVYDSDQLTSRYNAHQLGTLSAKIEHLFRFLDENNRRQFLATLPKVQHLKSNLLTGKPILVDDDCPASCDPSTETYHCM